MIVSKSHFLIRKREKEKPTTNILLTGTRRRNGTLAIQSGGSGGHLGLLVHKGRLAVGRLQDLEGTHQPIIHGHHGARIVKLAAVIWGREDGH